MDKRQNKTSSNEDSVEKDWEEFESTQSEKEKNTVINKEEDSSKSYDIYPTRRIDPAELYHCFKQKSNKGLVGSQNLGNTCFMNSAIQCLSHSLELTTYFLSDSFKKVRKSGKLSKAWTSLLKDLWINNIDVVNAKDIKRIISKRAKIFSGYDQNDSHELITYFLEMISEEQKQGTNKKYIELQEKGENESEEEAAKRFWDLYRKLNDSIVTDLFAGQFKSTLTCLECGYISITFDPFISITTPIPEKEFKKIFFIPKYSLLKTSVLLIGIEKENSASDLFKMFKSNPLFKYDIHHLRCMIVFSNKFIRHLKVKDNFYKIDREGYLFCYDIDDDEIKSKDSINAPLYYSVSRKEYLSTFPRNIRLNPEMTYSQFRKLIFYYARKYINVPFESNFQNEYNAGIKDPSTEAINKLIKICEEDYDRLYSKNDNKEITEFFNDIPFDVYIQNDEKEEKIIFQTDKENESIKDIVKILRENETELHLRFKESKYFNLNMLKTINAAHNCIENSKKVLSLYDCISHFEVKESLESKDCWYCKRCKKFQKSTKILELFYLPKLLIIHFNRFKSNHSYWFKNDIGISFPIDNLDLSTYVVGPNKKSYQYELYAVSEHYGSCGGGHYTASCRNGSKWYSFNDSHLQEISEDQIVSSSAYVLFYRKKTE